MEETQQYSIRGHQLGDMSRICYRHAMTVAEDYGWGEAFEGIVLEITAQFIQTYQPDKERCFIAEQEGTMLGCIFIVDAGNQAAKLRLLFVEPEARGMGLAKRLVDEAIQFSKAAGYKKVQLWTMKILTSARHIYKKAGFKLVHEEINEEFGENLISETWELNLEYNEETRK